jgi:hypothetical protein
MKKMFLALLMLGSSIGVFAQSMPQTSPPTSDKGMFYADLSHCFSQVVVRALLLVTKKSTSNRVLISSASKNLSKFFLRWKAL